MPEATITGATAKSRGAGHCVVELACEDGRRGHALAEEAVGELVPAMAAELLAGADPRALTANHLRLSEANARAHGALGAAVAALDCAMWDLKSQFEGVPLWRALGALAPRVRVHGRIGDAVDDAALEDAIRGLAARGFKDIVFTSSLDAGRDTARLTTARAVLGREAALMLDIGERLSAKESINLVTRVERDIDLGWIEGAAVRADFPGLRRVSDAIRGAVCAGKHYATVGDYLPSFHVRAIDIVQIDLARVGITGAVQIADAAFGLELPVTLAPGAGRLAVQVAAALPYCASIELEGADGLTVAAGFAQLAADGAS